jgi:hypothetical protein
MLSLSEDLFDSEFGASPSWENINKMNTEKVSTDEFASWWEKATHHKLHNDGSTFAGEGYATRLKELLGKLTLTGTGVEESATSDKEAPAFTTRKQRQATKKLPPSTRKQRQATKKLPPSTRNRLPCSTKSSTCFLRTSTFYYPKTPLASLPSLTYAACHSFWLCWFSAFKSRLCRC